MNTKNQNVGEKHILIRANVILQGIQAISRLKGMSVSILGETMQNL